MQRNLFDRLQRLNALIERVLVYTAGACLAVFTFVIFIDVIFRQGLHSPVLWPSEWALGLFIWSSLLGAAVAVRRQSHFEVSLLPEDLPNWFDQSLKVFSCVAVGTLAVVLAVYGTDVAVKGLTRYTPMMGYPLAYFQTAFPISGFFMVLFSIENLFKVFSGDHRATAVQATGV